MLTIIAILAGILTTLVIRRTTNQAALRTVRKRIYAHFLEFRLFFDEPGLIWQAQIALLRENARLLWLLLPPTLILALPMTWLFLQLEAVYGRRPFRPGEPAIVTAQLTRPIGAADTFDLQAPGGIAIETPPIRVFHDNQVAWRIRPASAFHGTIDLTFNGRLIRKTITTGDSPHLPLALHPEGPRLPGGDIAWVEVDYPQAGAAWMIWFVAVSTGAALLTPLRAMVRAIDSRRRRLYPSQGGHP